ncbi:hypothetical protein D3C76_1488260 [compost metagenome]
METGFICNNGDSLARDTHRILHDNTPALFQHGFHIFKSGRKFLQGVTLTARNLTDTQFGIKPSGVALIIDFAENVSRWYGKGNTCTLG